MSSSPPIWIGMLTDIVSDCIEAHSPMGPLRYYYYQEEEIWVIVVYPTPVELTGGSLDGMVVFAGFSLDLQPLLSAFERLEEAYWQAHSLGPHDEIGPHISLTGTYQGHQVWLQVLSMSPEDEEPGLQVDASDSMHQNDT